MILEIGYPAAIGGSLGKLSVLGVEMSFQALPLPALLNATWVLTLAIALRYCQTTVLVQRQYPYLHALEDAISPALGGDDLYRREGQVYLREYPLLLDAAWFAYGILFPLIVMFATVGLTIWELKWVLYTLPHIFFDAFIAGAIIVFFFLYRVQPAVASRWRKWQTRPPRRQQASHQSTITPNTTRKLRKP